MNKQHTTRHHYRLGVSLMEVLLVIALLTVLGSVMITVFTSSYRTYTIETKRAHLQFLLKGAAETMTRKIQQGQTVVSSQGIYTTSTSAVIVRLASIEADKDIIPSTYDYIIYRQDPTDSSQLQEITIAGSGSSRASGTRTILDNLTSFSIGYYDSSNVALNSNYANAKRLKISFTSQETYRATTVSTTFSQFITLRNK